MLSDSKISDLYFEALGSQHLREQDRRTVSRFALAVEAEVRMEAAIGIHVTWHSDGVVCGKRIWQETEMFEDHNGDKQAARRIASLRIAAEVGKATP